jgi:hypothetical protein
MIQIFRDDEGNTKDVAILTVGGYYLLTGILNLSDYSINWEAIAYLPTRQAVQSAWEEWAVGKDLAYELRDRPDLAEEPALNPDPMGFRNKLYGLSGNADNDLFDVYTAQSAIALNPATANAALTDARNILEGSLWNEPFSKPAFAAALNIIKGFMSPEQIVIVDREANSFNLVE